jgi:hypothetical protein
MIKFMTRLAVEKKLQICAAGGLPGLAIFHDCPDDDNSFLGLLNDFEKAQEGDCPWLAKEGDTCPTRKETCPSFPTATLPPCKKTGGPPLASTPPVVSRATPPAIIADAPQSPPVVSVRKCCKKITPSFASMQAETRKQVVSAVSVIKAFDCGKFPGAIQVIQVQDSGGYDVKALDIPTGKYNSVYHIPFSATTPANPAFTALNGVAINPIDDKAYGILTFGDKKIAWLVRFDDASNIEFVAKVKGFSVVGAFSSKGDYYYIRNGLNKIQQVATMEGFPSHTENVANFEDAPSITKTKGVTVQDLVAYQGHLEGGLEQFEYILALDKANKLLVVKDAGQMTQDWLLPTSETGETIGFGAGWNFKGRVYFSGNSGAGVYEIPVATMDVYAGAVMLKKVGVSEETAKNDGMNCMNAETPFLPPEAGCGNDYLEVPAQEEDGSCPAGSFRT